MGLQQPPPAAAVSPSRLHNTYIDYVAWRQWPAHVFGRDGVPDDSFFLGISPDPYCLVRVLDGRMSLQEGHLSALPNFPCALAPRKFTPSNGIISLTQYALLFARHGVEIVGRSYNVTRHGGIVT